MAANRKIPFGYRMEFGEYVPQPVEAETVCWIYQIYLTGASYKALVDALQKRGVPYDKGKFWNKNMVARILEDRRYIGENGYPPLIPEEQLLRARELRQGRTAPARKTPAQTELRRLCGGSPPDWVERQVLTLLNQLIQAPDDIVSIGKKAWNAAEISDLRRELEDVLHTPPVDGEQAKAMAFRLAEHRLNSIGPEEYETIRLRRVFQTCSPMRELEREILRGCVRSITYTEGTVQIQLKNGQTFKGVR